MKSRHFTLTELIAVIAIMLIVGGLVVGQFGRVPAFASLEKSAGEVERLFTYASYVAVMRGREVMIVYEQDAREFRMAEAPAVTDEDEEEDANGKNDLPRKYLQDKYGSLRLDAGLQVEFGSNTDKDKKIEFHCYPDGLASGPVITLSLNKHEIKLRISPLTGAVLREEVAHD